MKNLLTKIYTILILNAVKYRPLTKLQQKGSVTSFV